VMVNICMLVSPHALTAALNKQLHIYRQNTPCSALYVRQSCGDAGSSLLNCSDASLLVN
jgi:hypothetical protein